MFFGAGERQKPLFPDGVILLPQRIGTSWKTWPQTLE